MDKDFLTLLDGRKIMLFPQTKENITEKETLANEKQEQKDAQNVLLENIELLMENAERILTDSRMFLALLPNAGGLMYGSSKTFENPVLGTYLQWWMTCDQSHFVENGKKNWICHFAGSPLSGMNTCQVVNEDGELSLISVRSFKDLWRPFLRINKHYTVLSSSYKHYTLREVVDKLKKSNN